jgi:4-amino-4-deoxy-L-arabinose transferase-like glycosyltransferase
VTRKRRHNIPSLLIVIVAAGAALRLAWSVYAVRTPKGLHDPLLYHFLAQAVATGHGYSYPPPFNGAGIGYAPTGYYPPGYPLLLGALEWVTDHTPLPDSVNALVVAINLVAGIAAIVLVYAIARRIADERTGLIAAALVAFWPNLIFHTAVALSETMFIAFLLLTIWLAVNVPRNGRSWARLAAVGGALGLAVLVRPVALPLIGALAIAWLIAGIGWRDVLVRTSAVTIVCIAVLVPWIVRNEIVIGSAVLSTNTGDNLCMSRQPDATGSFLLTDYCNSDLSGLHRPASEVKKDDDGRHKAITFVREHPATEVRLWISRLHYGYQNDADGLRAVESYESDPFLPSWLRTSLKAAANIWFVAVSALAAVSLFWWLRRRDFGGWFLFGSVIAVGVIPIVAFFGDARFHVPVDPLFAILAAGLLSGWLLSRGAKEPSDASAMTATAPTPAVTATTSATTPLDEPQPHLPVPGAG